MKPRRLILRGFACIFILILMLKTGGGLYLHHWLHESPAPVSKQVHYPTSLSEEVLNCTCFDEFSIPFSENPFLVINDPLIIPQDYFIARYVYPPIFFLDHQPKRGPPNF